MREILEAIAWGYLAAGAAVLCVWSVLAVLERQERRYRERRAQHDLGRLLLTLEADGRALLARERERTQ